MEADQPSIKPQASQTTFQQATPVRPRTPFRTSLVHKLRDALTWLGLSAARAVLLFGFTALAFGMLVRAGLHAFDCAVMTLRLSCNAYLVLCKNAMSSYRNSSTSPYFTVGLVLWSLHMIYSSYLAYHLPDLPAAWQQLFNTGLINILLLVSTMMDYTLTGDRLPKQLTGALSMIHGTNIAVTLLFKCGNAQRGCVSAMSSTVLPLLASAVLPKLWWHKRRQSSSVPAGAVTSTESQQQQQQATHHACCLGRAPSTPPSRIVLDSAGEMHSTDVKAGLELPPVVQAPALLTLSDPQPPATIPTTTAQLPNSAATVKDRATDTLFGLLGHTVPPVATQAARPSIWQLAGGHDQQQLQVRRSDSSRSAGQAVNPAAVMNLVHAHRQPQYVSRLGRKSKLCLKVRTDRQMADLPADLGDHMQRALDEIGGPRLHIMDVAVRPGCILMSLDLLQKQQQRLSSDSIQPATMLNSLMGAGFPASSAVGTDAAMLESIAAALTPLLEPLLEVQQHNNNNTKLGLPSNVRPVKPVTLTDNEYLRIQIGHTVASVIWSHESGGWLLAPLLHPAAAVMAVGDSAGMGVISNKAKLGMAATMKASMTADGGISVQALLLLLGVGDENVVIQGWQPPAPGDHSVWSEMVPFMMPSSTSSCSSSLTASSITTTSTSTVGGPGQPVRVIVRAGGGYLSTAVKAMPLQVAGPVHHDVPTTLQVSFTVPQQVAARHHASSPASSLQPGLHIELWHGDVLLSSVPLLTLGPGGSMLPDDTTTSQNPPFSTISDTVATSAGFHSQAVHEPMWWGVDHVTTAAAIKELHDLATDIVSGQWMDWQMSEADLLQRHNSLIEFEKDLQIWLQHVQRCMQSSGLCVSTRSSKDPLMAGWMHDPCLDESQAEQLGRDLIDFAEGSGLQAVQQMIASQRDALKAGKHVLVAKFTKLPTIINAIRNAAFGTSCQHCEALHRTTVEQVVQGLCHTYSCFMLVAVLAACCVFVNHPVRRLVPAVAALPCMLHFAAVISWPVAHSRLAAHSSSSTSSNQNLGTAAPRPVNWVVAQWLPLLSMVLRNVAQMALLAVVGKSAWPRASIGPWVAVQACTSLAEQVQLSLVLSPATTVLSAALLDVPSMAWLLSHGSATFSVGTYALIAGLLIVMPRLLLVAQWYMMTFKEATSTPRTITASRSHDHEGDISHLPNGKATSQAHAVKLD